MEGKPKPQRQRRKGEKRLARVAAEAAAKTAEKMENQKKTQNPKGQRARRRRAAVKLTSNQGERVLTVRTLQREINRLRRQEKKLEGPRIENVLVTTITLGTILGTSPQVTTTNQLGRQMKTCLNPLLLKPADSDKAVTPLTTRASQYGLYKILTMKVKIQPLVGPSLVAGALAILDIQQNGASATPDSLDTIKARRHVEIALGKSRLWTIPAKDLEGPRDGWWYVDTNDDPTQSLGPAMNTWLYGKTFNLLSTKELLSTTNTTQYNGPCWLVELEVKYAFSNYSPKPALATLLKKDFTLKENQGTLGNDIDGALLLHLDKTSEIGNTIWRTEMRDSERAGALGSTFWSVSSQVVGLLADSLGAWGWVARTGWFVLRQVFGGGFRKDTITMKVYASAEDASKDSPLYVVPSGGSSKPLPPGQYRLEQLNSANLMENTNPEPTVRMNPAGNEYLPLPIAGSDHREIPPIYIYNDGEIQKYDPVSELVEGGTEHQPWKGNECINLFGRPKLYWGGKNEETNKITITMIPWQIEGHATGKPTEKLTLMGKYFCLYDFKENLFVVAGNQIESQGVMHGINSWNSAWWDVWASTNKRLLSFLGTDPTPNMNKGGWRTQEYYGNGMYKFLWDIQAGDGSSGGTDTSREVVKAMKRVMDWSALYEQEGETENKIPTFAIPASKLGGMSPWDTGAPRAARYDAVIIWYNDKTYAITSSLVKPTDWTYWGPQFMSSYVNNADWWTKSPRWYELAELDTGPLNQNEEEDEDLEFLPPPPETLEKLEEAIERGDLGALAKLLNKTVPK
nr:MAG: capsid protein precursor [Astroviridae sp.]